jgi:hypothetical protein
MLNVNNLWMVLDNTNKLLVSACSSPTQFLGSSPGSSNPLIIRVEDSYFDIISCIMYHILSS